MAVGSDIIQEFSYHLEGRLKTPPTVETYSCANFCCHPSASKISNMA
jgi:hypothetical protein